MFAFFKNLHINLNIAIEKRKNFDATTDRETISVQNIDFFDIAIDEKFENVSKKKFKKVINDATINFDDEKNDTFFERSRTIFDVNIEKNENFDDIKNDEIINSNNEKNENIDCCEDFDFLT